MKNTFLAALSLLLASTLICSCNKDSNGNGQTTLHVRLTDAPVAAEAVFIDIREVRVKFTDDDRDDNWNSLQTNMGVYDLLAYQNGIDTLLATGTFPSRELKEIRLILGPSNFIKVDGVTHPLTIPSGAESGLKIKFNRSLNATLETVILDFDAALSIHQEGNGDYKLRPVIRIQ